MLMSARSAVSRFGWRSRRVLVHHLGPTPFFPVAGAVVAVAILERADAAGVPG